MTTIRWIAALGLCLFGPEPLAQAAPERSTPADVKAMLRSISPQRIEATVRKLVGFGTRHTLSDTQSDDRGIGAARRWIKAQLDACAQQSGGRLKVELDSFTAPPNRRIAQPTELVNVVATLPGEQAESAGRIYVVSGHYDSMPSNVLDPKSDAPGADDDASGTAAVIEMACAMSRLHFDATLVFMAVAGEEQGLVGSTHRVDRGRVRLFAEGVPDVKEMSDELRTLVRTGGENDTPTRELARFIKEHAERDVAGMRVDLVWRRDRYLRGGDHAPFLNAGYAAVRFTEPAENYHHQHQNVRVEGGVQYGDLPEFVDFGYIAQVARVNAAALAALAMAPAAPRGAQLETARLENDTTLHWDASTEPDLAGYRIVWRDTTAPLWQNHKDVGLVTRYSLPLSKDNVVFGVQAIDKDGNVSVASYPTPVRPPQPGGSEPASGQPASGQPASGQPASGQPASGQPASGQPASGQPPGSTKAPSPAKPPAPSQSPGSGQSPASPRPRA
ncbi:MAG: M20/M25/M40 family metallo-hydrolase [Deltaproteobacteria bacterium]|nr:MAG: M20/M25/M40 family metallo-hydrolase [Deltaproteobacteria bacterium]